MSLKTKQKISEKNQTTYFVTSFVSFYIFFVLLLYYQLTEILYNNSKKISESSKTIQNQNVCAGR